MFQGWLCLEWYSPFDCLTFQDTLLLQWSHCPPKARRKTPTPPGPEKMRSPAMGGNMSQPRFVPRKMKLFPLPLRSTLLASQEYPGEESRFMSGCLDAVCEIVFEGPSKSALEKLGTKEHLMQLAWTWKTRRWQFRRREPLKPNRHKLPREGYPQHTWVLIVLLLMVHIISLPNVCGKNDNGWR